MICIDRKQVLTFTDKLDGRLRVYLQLYIHFKTRPTIYVKGQFVCKMLNRYLSIGED